MGVEEILIMQAEERGISIGEERGISIGEERGISIGEERGISIGEERGISIGEERGIEKERTQAEKERFEYRKNIISNMRKEGFSIDKIANLMNLTVQEVKAVCDVLDAE